MPPHDEATGRRGGGTDQPASDVEAVLDELYTAPPDGFTALRDARAAAARKAGDADAARRIRALRRPTRSAWAGNLLVHHRPAETAQFLQLGEALRHAHEDLDAARMRDLSAQQWRVIAALANEAVNLAYQAGHRLSPSVQREVETTLRTVIADPAAAEQWASGRLTGPLTPPAGFAGAVAGSPAAPSRGRSAGGGRGDRSRREPSRRDSADELAQRRRRRAELDHARQRLKDAERLLRERRRQHTAAATANDRARTTHDQKSHTVEDLRQSLHAAEAEADRAAQAHQDTESALRGTGQAVTQAEAAVRDAEREVKRLSRGAT